MASFEVSLPIPDRLSLPTKSLASSNRGRQALESIHSHVRHFKQQAQEFLFSLVELFSSAAAGHGRRHDHPNDG